MRYKWGIPSYQRSDKPYTVDLLHKLGYTKEEIVVCTQTKDDYERYKATQGDKAIIIYKEGDNDSKNRNATLDYLQNEKYILLADDDIKAFLRLSADGSKLIPFETREELEKHFDAMFRYSLKNNCKLWAWYPVENAFFMKHTIDDKNILCGTVFGVVMNKAIRFDPSFYLKGDYEISLRLISYGMNTIRFNGYTCKANHRSTGGCEEMRKAGRNEKNYRDLLEVYPDLIAPSTRPGEIKFIGKIKHSKEEEMWK